MTPAELKTIREAVGLGTADLAALAGVQVRTVRYWESGRMRPPQDVQRQVLALDEMLTHAARQSVEAVREQARALGEMPEEIVLVRYHEDEDLWQFRPDMKPLPVTTHAALLARTRAALADLHVRTRIVYMEPGAYNQWRGGRVDSEPLRAEWAAQV